MADANASDALVYLSDTLEVGFACLPVSVLKLGATTLLVFLVAHEPAATPPL